MAVYSIDIRKLIVSLNNLFKTSRNEAQERRYYFKFKEKLALKRILLLVLITY